MKIDLSLVQGGASQDQTLSVLTSLVQLARRWGALTIAEGVETPEQLRAIRKLDVEAGQGYLLGRPGAILGSDTIDVDALAGVAASSGPGGAATGSACVRVRARGRHRPASPGSSWESAPAPAGFRPRRSHRSRRRRSRPRPRSSPAAPRIRSPGADGTSGHELTRPALAGRPRFVPGSETRGLG